MRTSKAYLQMLRLLQHTLMPTEKLLKQQFLSQIILNSNNLSYLTDEEKRQDTDIKHTE